MAGTTGNVATTGRFVWHELHTSDQAKAAQFYSQLMGWETKEFPMGPGETYVLCLQNGKDFAGITKSKAGPNVPPHWLSYIGVEDVDTAAKKVSSLGGKVVQPPMDIPGTGRFAVVLDPQGASFALYKHAKQERENPEQPPIGSFCWDELMTGDPVAASTFYTSLFGYSVDEKHMDERIGTYRTLSLGDRQIGGILKPPPGGPPPAWLPYIAVKDVDVSTRIAKELGARVMIEPSDIPNMGRFSIFMDPTNAMIALFAWK